MEITQQAINANLCVKHVPISAKSNYNKAI